jgi:hypothetical protein
VNLRDRSQAIWIPALRPAEHEPPSSSWPQLLATWVWTPLNPPHSGSTFGVGGQRVGRPHAKWWSKGRKERKPWQNPGIRQQESSDPELWERWAADVLHFLGWFSSSLRDGWGSHCFPSWATSSE